MSALVEFKHLSTFITDILRTFDVLCDKVLVEHNDKARELTVLCFNLHKEFYDHMRKISSVCDNSSTSIDNILMELKLIEQTKKLDVYTAMEIQKNIGKLLSIVKNHKEHGRETASKIVTSKEDITQAQTQLRNDRPSNTKYLDKYSEMMNSSKTLAILAIVPGIDSSIFFGQAIVGAIAVAIDGVNGLITRHKTKRYDAIDNVLKELLEKANVLSQESVRFHMSLDTPITDLEKYTELVDDLVRYSGSSEHSERLVIMAKRMLPKTETLQKDFEDIRKQALVNSSSLGNTLLRLNPRFLIDN